MLEISKFWVEVVGVDKPKISIEPPKAKVRRRLGADEQLEQAAEAAAYKAQIMHRLPDLIESYKEAVTSNPRGAVRLQKLFEAVRTGIEHQEFKKAAKDLDKLERLVDGASTDGEDEEEENQADADDEYADDDLLSGK